MAHSFSFTVNVEVERESGKFASREEIADNLRTWLIDADEGSIYGIGADADSTYNTTIWGVEDA